MPDLSFFSSLKIVVQAMMTLVLFASCVAAQQNSAARPDRGTLPNGSYAVSDIENITLQNGNVNLEIPLASLPPIAGGKLSWTIKAHYNSKLWDITRTQHDAPDQQWNPYVADAVQLSDRGGWRISGQYVIEIRPASWDFDYAVPPPDTIPYNEYYLLNNYNWYKTVLVMPDGSEHELRPVDYAAAADATSLSFLHGYYNVSPYTHGTMRYYSFDGSYLWATVTTEGNWTVYLNDGTKVVQTPDGIQRIHDTNGNKIKIYSDTNGTHYQDEQTGREIRYGYDPTANNGQGAGGVWYRTVGGAEKYIEIKFGNSTVQGKVYRVDDWIPGQVNPHPCTRNGLIYAQMTVIREIVLPQTEQGQAQRKFKFSYNSDNTETATSSAVRFSCSDSPQSYTRTVSKGWGALSRIETPSGATVDYSYSLDSGNALANLPTANEDIAGESITQKALEHDDVTDVWHYEIESPSGVSKVINPDQSEISENRYTHAPFYGYGIGPAGLTYRTVQPFRKVERHWIGLQFDGANIFSPGGPVSFNPVVDLEYTTLTDVYNNNLKMSAKAFQYDFNGNVIQTTEYDWFDPSLVSRDSFGVPTGVPAGATVLRVTNSSYYNSAGSSNSGNVYAKRALSTATPLILNALKQTTLGPAITQLAYDGQGYGTAPTAGNLTTKRIWDDVDSKWISTSSIYGAYGNLMTSIDALGNATQFYYDDTTHALPNRVVVDPQNGTGPQTATTIFDYHTGLAISQTDSNGGTSTVDYTNHLLNAVDPFGRPGVAIGPVVNGQRRKVFTFYEDASRRVRVESDLFTEGDRLLKSKSTSDELGRPILIEETEDGTNYSITATTAYEQMGRITFTSNPRRPGVATTDGWTRTTTDIAGRLVEVANFAGSERPPTTGTNWPTWTGSMTTTYDANFTTVTDQADKVRRTMTDALGRLVRADEPDNNNPLSNDLGPTASPLQPTYYSYDVFGNLLTVVQGSQTRIFTYDSVSRLRSAHNPENGTLSYIYDDNGNVTRKTDSRGIYMDYIYDAVNRNTTVNYSDTTISPDITRTYDGATNGKGRPWETYAGGNSTTGSNVEHTKIQSYNALGQPLIQVQDFKANGVWTPSYQTQRNYNLAGAVTSQVYPSGRTVDYAYDSAGRIKSFSGSLGDGITRTYSTGIQYSPLGGIAKEQFGTDMPVYNKSVYNSRGQLSEIRVGTFHATDESWWNRGAIINHYSSACPGTCNGSGNNGNLKKQDVLIPANDQITSSTTWSQTFDYDNLNRLQRVHENTGNTQLDWQQEYAYDRYGNRSINQSATSQGKGINATQAAVIQNTTSNRMYAAGENEQNHPLINYDAAGNQIKDYYSSAGVSYDRTYDAENRMTTSVATYASPASTQSSTYSYNAEGQRVRRNVNGVETFQIYGFDGELLAEYAASGPASTPQKEYGYRNKQLLISADGATRTNFALASNGAIATASSVLSNSFPAIGANNGDRKGANWENGGGWRDAPPSSTFPDWLQIDFGVSKTIDEIDVFTLQDNYQNPLEPTETMTFSLYGQSGYDVQYWTGSAWTTVVGGNISSNNKIWRKINFSPITTSKVRVLTNASPDGFSRLTEVEAWGSTAPSVNVARSSSGATATAQNYTQDGVYAGLHFQPAYANDGTRYATPAGDHYWRDEHGLSSWIQIDFGGTKTIDEVDVYTLADYPTYTTQADPSATQTFTHYGATSFTVEYWTGSAWAALPGGAVTGNTLVWKKINFAAITTSKIRVRVNAAADSIARITEVEAWTTASGTSANINWLVADQLGTPRMVIDQSGSLVNMKRHDYLPFGEEMFANQGLRTSGLGYSGDGVRQKFTSKERDSETGLDYFLARYSSSVQGRFTSSDPLLASGRPAQPQSWNRYSFNFNNPLKYIDPSGMEAELVEASGGTDEAERRQQQQQQTHRVLIIVGDPGLGNNNEGKNFDRAAKQRQGELEAAGSEVIVQRASSVQDFNAVLNNNGTLNSVEYMGHAGPGALYIGEQPGENTNLNSSTISQISGKNLASDATIVLTACNTAVNVRENDSIGRQVANQLQRTTIGYNGDLEFSSNRNAPSGKPFHPNSGPTYLVPSSRNVKPIGFTPYISSRPPY